MTISTEELQKALDSGLLRSWEPAVFAELLAARAKIEAAEKLAEAADRVAVLDADQDAGEAIIHLHDYRKLRHALAAWEAAQ